eukprot:2486031-Heterocapsa_arctica.AAC.1
MGRPNRCTRTGVHDKGDLHNKYGHRKQQVWSMCLKLKIGLKLRLNANLSAFCKESDGDSEDAGRPLENLQTHCKHLHKPSKPYTPECVHL